MVVYRHSKSGKLYEIINVAEHSETHEALVIYKDFMKHEDNEKHIVWARPLDMFMGMTTINGESVSRFEKLESIEDIFTEEEIEELKAGVSSDHYVKRNSELFKNMLGE